MNTGNIVSAVFGTIIKVVFVIAAIWLIYRGASICYEYGYRTFTEPAVSLGSGRTVTVNVTSDMSAYDIGKDFEAKGLTRDAKLFALQYTFSEFKQDVKPGVYELSTAMTVDEMMQVMAGLVDEEEETEE